MSSAHRHLTGAYLAQRLSESGIRLKHRHGQNFLIDANLMRLLVDRAELSRDDVVLEVGTGTGGLTSLIAPRVAEVVSVEIDPQLHQLASEELAEFPNVLLLCHDALAGKSHLDPRIIAAVEERLAAEQSRTLKVVANLPFNVATSVIANLLAAPIIPRTMTVTMQKEVADRIVAVSGTKDFGALSVWVQSQCRAEVLRALPPSVFWPRPQVTSAIIQITHDAELRARIADLEFFHDFIRALFSHRRKHVRRALASAYKGELDVDAIDGFLAAAGVEPTLRAEQLDVPTILRLCQVVRGA